MDDIVEAIAALVRLMCEVALMVVRAVNSAITALLIKEKREKFKSEWSESRGFKVGVILSGALVIMVVVFVAPLFYGLFNSESTALGKQRHDQTQHTVTLKNENVNDLKVKWETEKGALEFSVSKETAKNLWGKSKNILSKVKGKLNDSHDE